MREREIKVLDDGFIKLVDYMGGDDAIVQAARVSYGKGTKKVSEDRGLIRYLMRHHHTTPFEMVEFKFHIRIPMDAWRQMIRHRTANVNEYSTRYSEAIDSQQRTPPNAWRNQSKDNKQGSGDFFTEEDGEVLTHYERDFLDEAKRIYQYRLGMGVAREQARKDLPLSTYTEAYWKCDLHNIFHFLRLRMDAHAQYEIRQYANAMYKLIKPVCPIACEAFEDYRLNAVQFSGPEMKLLNNPLVREAIVAAAKKEGIDKNDISMRELKEFKQKLGITTKLSS